MKKGKRMLAVLLAAVLCVGMVSNPVLTSVLAQEESETPQSVGGNEVESAQEETKPAEGAESDEMQESAADTVETAQDKETIQEETEPETTQEKTEPETTVESEDETQESISANSTAEEETQENVSENSTAEEGNGSIQELLERIVALPDAEEYLAAEPDMEEDLAKLTAWAELAETITGGQETYALGESSGNCGGAGYEKEVKWSFNTFTRTLTIKGSGPMADYNSVWDAPWTKDGNVHPSQMGSLVINSGITHIGDNAFAGVKWTNIGSVTIPETVSSIGANAFSTSEANNSNFVIITMEATDRDTIPELGTNCFKSDCIIKIPSCEFYDAYCEAPAPGWSAYKDNIKKEHKLEDRESINAKEPTCMETGNKAYWRCNVCGDLFADEGQTSPTTLEAVILPINADNHSYTYSARDAVITESCANGCGHSATAALSVKSGADLTYTGSAIQPVTVTYSDGWGGIGTDYKPNDANISYSDNTNVGIATAELSIGGAKAQINFTIKAASHTVTLHTNGGKGGTNLTSYIYGTGAELPTDWTKTGYTFAGWYEKEDCTGSAVTKIPANAAGDKEYWAGWTPINYSVTYVLNGGNVSGNPTSYTIESSTITLNNPTKEGYVFTGWSGTGLTGEANQTVKVPKGSSGDREYTAHWAVPPHSHAEISFDTVLTAGGTLNSGNYYLDSDIDGSITIKGTVNLCLNGHTLQKSGADYIVTVGSGATLNLYDCGASGNITGHKIQSRPGAVVRVTGGTFNMYGGTIKDSWIQSANGGGVYVDSGTFHMYGGTISGNKNQSGKGGGVYVNKGTFHMSGGTISGNSGYGVYIDSGSVTVSGAPKITGNSFRNVYLNSGKTITITDALSDTASIGVETKTLPSDGSPVAITGTNSADYSHCFFSDTTGYEIQNSGSGSSQVVQLVLPHTHSYTYSADGAVITESCSCGHSETAALSVVNGADLTYTGSAIEACRVTYSDGWKGGTLTLNYSDHINAGTAKAEISKNGETASLEFIITAKSLTDSMVSGLSPAYEWTGNAVMPSVTVKDGSKTLAEGMDYMLSYAGNINVGNNTAAVTIKGTGNYTGSITKTFTIYKNWNIILHSGGGSGTDLTVYEQGTGVTLPTDWTREGYVFEGWYDNESFSGEKVTEISATSAGNKEYWAKWTDNIAPVIGTLEYSYQPKNLWHWLIGKDSLIITVPVTEEGSGADEITCTVTPGGAAASTKTEPIKNGEAKITVSADFKGTISIACTDKAGNTSAGVTVGAGLGANGIIIEDHAPQIAFQAEKAELMNTGEYRTAPDIAVTVSDDKDNAISGGIASVSYKIGNGSEQTVPHDYTTGMVANDSFTIPAGEIPAGETVISVTAIDNAGNSITEAYTVKVHIHSGTLVTAKAATCTEDGHEAYYTCSCGKWFSDSGCVNEITDHASVAIGKLGHDFSGQYLFDASGHWKVCSRCSTAQTAENHVFDDDNDTTCNKCGYQRTIGTHTHSAEGAAAATEPTCTTAGNKTYYICSCGKWFSDSACTKEVTVQDVTIPAKGHTAVTDPAKAATCTETGLTEGSHCPVCGHVIKAQTVTAESGHDYGDYIFDAGGHWKVCRRCGAANAKRRHNYDNDRDAKCNDCGWVRVILHNGEGGQPTPTPEPTPQPPVPTPTPQPPSPTNPPEQPQPTEKPDNSGTVPGMPDNSQSEDRKEPKSTGTPEPTVKLSGTGKEQQPEGDGEQTVPASIDNGKIVISGEPVATGNVEGMTDTSTVLNLGNGAVIVTVVCAEQEYTAGVADTLAVANEVLTPEQIQLVNNGETIEIKIDVKDISEQVPEQDKEVIENGIEEYQKEVPGFVLGMYVDISMFIRIGGGDWNAITEADEPIEIIIGIPEKLQEKGREYIIIRAHDGVHTFMDDMDDDPSTITVSTDLFSSYAIAYVQAEGTGHKCGLCHICPTFLGICYFVWLAIIILIMIVVIILLRKKKEEQGTQDIGQ